MSLGPQHASRSWRLATILFGASLLATSSLVAGSATSAETLEPPLEKTCQKLEDEQITDCSLLPMVPELLEKACQKLEDEQIAGCSVPPIIPAPDIDWVRDQVRDVGDHYLKVEQSAAAQWYPSNRPGLGVTLFMACGATGPHCNTGVTPGLPAGGLAYSFFTGVECPDGGTDFIWQEGVAPAQFHTANTSTSATIVGGLDSAGICGRGLDVVFTVSVNLTTGSDCSSGNYGDLGTAYFRRHLARCGDGSAAFTWLELQTGEGGTATFNGGDAISELLLSSDL